MFRSHSVLILLTLSVLCASCASMPWEAGRYDLSVEDGRIQRRDSGFTLRAIHEPDVCARGAELSAMVPIMARVAEVGGNTIAFDLCGFNEDGTELAAESVATVSAYADRARNQRMAVLVRVIGEGGTAEFRRNAVATAAKALYNEARAAYWIDGPDAAALAARFKDVAPHLVLAAPENGDVTVTDDPSEAGDSGLFLLKDALPRDPHGDVNYVLADLQEAYALLDAAYMREAEKADWMPDNSMLSEEEREEGFVALFNGRDLDNWWPFNYGEDSFYVNEDGYIEFHGSGAGAVMTNKRYDNFILRFEYNITEKDGNSGVFLRAPRAARQSKIGFEFQIIGDSYLTEPHDTSTGAVYDVLAPLTVAARPEGEWNEVELVLNGPHYRAKLNGVLVQDVNFDEVEEMRYRLRRGFIGLQDHSDHVLFRNVRIKEL